MRVDGSKLEWYAGKYYIHPVGIKEGLPCPICGPSETIQSAGISAWRCTACNNKTGRINHTYTEMEKLVKEENNEFGPVSP